MTKQIRKIYTLTMHGKDILSFSSKDDINIIIDSIHDILNEVSSKIDEGIKNQPAFSEEKPNKKDYVKTDYLVDKAAKLAELKKYSEAVSIYNKAKDYYPIFCANKVIQEITDDFIKNDLPKLDEATAFIIKDLIKYYGNNNILHIRNTIRNYKLLYLSDNDTHAFQVVEEYLYQ